MAAIAYPLPHDRRSTARPALRLVGGASARPAITPGTYRRRRATAVVVVLALGLGLRAVLGGLGGGPLAASEPASMRPVAAVTYVVQPGDTLWAIARRAQPTGDVRSLVDSLARAHGPGPLLVGERLTLQ